MTIQVVCVKPPVDTKKKVAFYYMGLILKRNFCFVVNGRFDTTLMVTMYVFRRLFLSRFRLVLLLAASLVLAADLTAADECHLTPVIHVLQFPGCTPKPIPSFACAGRCTSYVQVGELMEIQLLSDTLTILTVTNDTRKILLDLR